jgi:hypothetical protein
VPGALLRPGERMMVVSAAKVNAYDTRQEC